LSRLTRAAAVGAVRRRFGRPFWWLALGLAALASPATAQTSLQVPLQFDFINPGAKSLSLGGAFSGLADDATATFANPAGLTELGASEVSFELRGTRVATPFLESGRLSGPISNQGTDTVQGPRFGESVGKYIGPGFAAGVYLSPSRRWVAAGHMHELIRIDQAFFSTGVFQKAPEEFTSRRDSPQLGIRTMTVRGYGASGAYRLGPGISVGGSLSLYTFDFDSRYQRFDVDGFLGPPAVDRELQRTTQIGANVSLAPTAGVMLGRDLPDPDAPLWRRIRAGVVYRHGPTFTYTTQARGLPPDEGLRFRVPHTLAVGASLRLTPRFILAGEVSRIGYSRIRDDFVADQARADGRAGDFSIDDGTEIHVGVQYAMPRFRAVPRFRVGAWFDPDHSVRFAPSQPSTTIFDRLFDERLAAALSQGRDQVHVTGGIGLTLHRRLELNAGTDISPTQFRLSTSIIIR
jgi:long-subunit fatty acid transport protein